MIKEYKLDLTQDHKILLSKGLTYYSYNFNYDDSKKWALEWVKINLPDLYKPLSDVSANSFSNRGFVCRLIIQGLKITDKQMTQLKEFFDFLILNKNNDNTDDKQSLLLKKVTPIGNPLIGQLQEIEDHIIANENYTQFDIFRANRKQCEDAKNWIEKETIEINEQINQLKNIDEQLQLALIKLSHNEKTIKINNSNNNNKQIMKTVKYLPIYKPLNLKSINPIRILEAKKVFIFNVSNNTAFVYIANDRQKLTIQGSSIRNFNPQISFKRKIRNPNLFFEECIKTSPFDEIMNQKTKIYYDPISLLSLNTIIVELIK